MRIDDGRYLVLLFGLGLSSVACSSTEAPLAPPVTPAVLNVSPDQRVVLKLTGKGAQVYACSAHDLGRFDWTLARPDADLLDAQGNVVGKHGRGPTWELSGGGQVAGEVKAKVDAPDPGAIPWLLLEAKSSSWQGILTKVKSIQRVNTKGGKAPAGECDANHVGAEARVAYEADYFFYAPR
jgi:hypothetical protein